MINNSRSSGIRYSDTVVFDSDLKWCNFIVCPNPDCVEIIKKEGARSLFGQNCKCPYCGHEWIANWAIYRRCSERTDWHLKSFKEFYKGQTTLDEFWKA